MEPSSEWLLENLRVTAFGDEFDRLKIANYWAACFDSPPDQMAMNRASNQSIADAVVEDRRYNLAITDHAMQLQMLPTPKSDEFALLRNWDEQLLVFNELCLKWLTSPLVTLVPVKRLAFGVVMDLFVENSQEGYSKLHKLLPLLAWDDSASDLIYQINRPRQSTVVENLKINRLSNWSVVSLSLVNITGQAGVGGILFQDTQSLKSQPAVRLMLDINTSNDFEGELPGDKLPLLLKELIQFGCELKDDGDQK